MANIIQLKRSSVAGKRPDAVDLQVGEIAVNLADGILYSKNTAGYVVVVGSAKTSNVIEDGNLYFTTARARSSISAGDSSIIYDSVNGTIRANVAALGGANVISVNGFDGIVVLDTDDISEGSANLYFTNTRAILSVFPATTQLVVTTPVFDYNIDQYSGDNPEIYVTAGETISFDLNQSASHPFAIRVSDGGSEYNVGLTHVNDDGTISTGSAAQGKHTGKLFWKIPYDLAGNTYVYQCTSHSSMVGNIVIGDPAAINSLTTNVISEGSNLYFTDERVYANVVLLDYATNSTVGEVFDQSNTNITIIGLSFDQANTATTYALSAYDQANTVFDTVNALTTTEVTEGDNLYFTNTRAVSAFTPGTGINIDANGLILSTVTGGEGGSSGGNVTVSSSPPTSPVQGDVWIDAETGAYLTYFSDGDSNQWAEVASSVVFGGQGGGVADLTSNIVIGTDGDPTNVIIHSTITGNLTPSDNEVYDLGSADYRWRDLYLSGNTIALGNATISASGDGIVLPANSTVGAAAIASPRISSIDYPGDDTAADPDGGQTVSIVGSGFVSGASVILGTTTVGVVSFISSTELQITTPAKAAGSYTLYVINPDGGTGIFIPGFQYSGTPTWNSPSAGSLGSVYETGSISETLNATSDGTVTYSLLSGTLPAGSTLDANAGTITGTASNVDSPTTYNFTIRATDEENQDTDRAFSLTIDPDAISWTTPTEGSVVQLEVNAASNTNLLATSVANDTITYSANALPTGLTLTGNVISGTPNTIGNVSATLTASGDNTNKSNVINITWSIVVGGDQYFKNTSLLLNADDEYLCFNDYSDNDFPISTTGNPLSSNFGPFMVDDGNWSIYQPATSTDTLNFGSGDWTFSGDFTIEGWVYYTTATGGDTSFYVLSSGSTYFAFNISMSAGVFNIYLNSSSVTSSFSHGINSNEWTHVALVRSSGTITVYTNGVSKGTISNSSTLGFNNPSFNRIGGGVSGVERYVSNFRVINGSAQYTTGFTPPTTPLTDVTNTVILTAQSNRFVDNSGTTTPTVGGSIQVKPRNPFTTTYSTSLGSGYFSSGRYATVPDNDSLDPNSDSFTLDAWVYPVANAPSGYGVAYSKGDFCISLAMQVTTNDFWCGISTSGSSWTNEIDTNRPLRLFEWSHIALVRDATAQTITAYINGEQVGQITGFTSAIANNSNPGYIGVVNGGASQYFPGYISNLRFNKGEAINFSSVGIPTSPTSSNANTELLTCKFQGSNDNKGFKDTSAVPHIIIQNGDPVIGSFSPFSTPVGKWSAVFDGNGDRIGYPFVNNGPLDVQKVNNFTIECFVYLNSLKDNTIITTGIPRSNFYYRFGIGSNGQVVWSTGTGAWSIASSVTSSNGVIEAGRWYHVAAVRNGSSDLKLYVDGVQVASATHTHFSGTVTTSTAYIGTYYDDTNATGSWFDGYISNFRVLKGTSLYTGSYTVPDEPLTNITNTTLLTCRSNSFKDFSSSNLSATNIGNVKVVPSSPFAPSDSYDPAVNGGSSYFFGIDYMTSPSSPDFYLPEDFTIESWVYYTTLDSSTYRVIAGVWNGNGTYAWLLHLKSDIINFAIANSGTSAGNFTPSVSLKTGEWYHVAVSRSGSSVRIYLNGVQVGSTYTSTANLTGNAALEIGWNNDGNQQYMTGYISGLRIIKGEALYTSSSFTLPTAPPTPTPQTTFLLSDTTAGIKDLTGKNNIATIADAKIRTGVKKFGSGSIYLDGTGDYLTSTISSDFEFGTGQFTVEAWVYINADSGNARIVGIGSGAYSTSAYTGWNFVINQNLSYLMFYRYDGTEYAYSTAYSFSTGQWYHLAASRDSNNTLRTFVNGQVLGTHTNVTLAYNRVNSDSLYVGAQLDGFNGVSWKYTNGYIDDLRITKGVARYTSNFDPPTSALKTK